MKKYYKTNPEYIPIHRLIPNYDNLPKKWQTEIEEEQYWKQLHCSHTYMLEEEEHV